MFCPQCGAEYRAGFTVCADCGVDLVDEAPVEGSRGANEHPQLVVIGRYTTEFQAHMAMTALAAAGIEATVRSEDAGGLYPGLAFTRGVDLLVRTEDAAEARGILEGVHGAAD